MAGKNVFRFKCGKCRKEAMNITLTEKSVIVQSPFKESVKYSKPSAKIRKALRERNLHALDYYLELDCFCPECGKVYCGNHMKQEINFEADGWYDDATFTCPKKHSRSIG